MRWVAVNSTAQTQLSALAFAPRPSWATVNSTGSLCQMIDAADLPEAFFLVRASGLSRPCLAAEHA